jgi:hypothetical protein
MEIASPTASGVAAVATSPAKRHVSTPKIASVIEMK